MGFSFHISNYRAIRSVSFNPEGVCLIVGPNGSGKTTLLSSLEFLRNACEFGFRKALSLSGGAGFFHNPNAKTGTQFVIENKAIRWELHPEVNAGGISYILFLKLFWQMGKKSPEHRIC